MDWIYSISQLVKSEFQKMPEDQEQIEGEALYKIVRSFFDEPLTVEKDQKTVEIQTSPILVDKLTTIQLRQCLSLVDKNLGETMTLVYGKDWKSDKVEEMRDPGLVYLLLHHDTEFVGFISIKAVEDNESHVLYIYELQIVRNYRRMGLGSKLLGILDQIVELVNSDPAYTSKFGKLEGLSLTVFSSNEGAKKLYFSKGYRIASHSPAVRYLRNRKIQPDYFILVKNKI
ncbi:hypothetical protein KL911_002197 [Ogataea haglerorum]|uniref:uncharacterized protein n=1 Tax=Ogataea haglerorum TaxID=1937702 RepID=UPI001C8AC013|nr:uncharacterized protein KL911_002197 [Ogataea haglerorum]KAG7748847.1 hypothetical protein KL912_001909 [Ogataea haglerorum]KAG7754758.1 hypothetical protein KL911_002197 [Ogataea haglerorum]